MPRTCRQHEVVHPAVGATELHGFRVSCPVVHFEHIVLCVAFKLVEENDFRRAQDNAEAHCLDQEQVPHDDLLLQCRQVRLLAQERFRLRS